jgi:hypothetical protein
LLLAGIALMDGVLMVRGITVLELSEDERREAEGLVDVAEFLTLLRVRAERLAK